MKPDPPKKRSERHLPASSEDVDGKREQPAGAERTDDDAGAESQASSRAHESQAGEQAITNQDQQEKVTNAPDDDGPVAEK